MRHQRGDIVDESPDLGVEVAVADREARTLMANDFAGEFKGANGMNEYVEPHLFPKLGERTRRVETRARTRDVHERTRAMLLIGRAEHIELRSETRVIATIQGLPLRARYSAWIGRIRRRLEHGLAIRCWVDRIAMHLQCAGIATGTEERASIDAVGSAPRPDPVVASEMPTTFTSVAVCPDWRRWHRRQSRT